MILLVRRLLKYVRVLEHRQKMRRIGRSRFVCVELIGAIHSTITHAILAGKMTIFTVRIVVLLIFL